MRRGRKKEVRKSKCALFLTWWEEKLPMDCWKDKFPVEWLRKKAQQQTKQLTKTTKKITPQWAIVGALFFVAAIAAIDWAAKKNALESAAPTLVPTSSTSPLTEGTPSAWSYFHPSWRNVDGWLFKRAPSDNKLQNSAKEVRNLVDDPYDRIENEFIVPESLRSRVIFWMEIYSRYNSRMRVVHDRLNPNIVYGYIDLRSVYRAHGNTVLADVKANEIEKKVLKELKLHLQEAVGISNSKTVSPEEIEQLKTFLSQVGALSPKDTLSLISRIRTQTGQSDMFLSALYRARQLLPHIESVFRRQNLPVALGRIPFVESSFNPKAYSKGGAIGIWQFMPETAREMIHHEEEHWDDPLKQTASAARLLRMYRSVLPDWGSAVTSYNSGVGRVRRLIQKHKLKTVEELLNVDDNDGLGFAGKNFYAEFLAANLVEAYKEELFENAMGSSDFNLVFKGDAPFPKEYCDL